MKSIILLLVAAVLSLITSAQTNITDSIVHQTYQRKFMVHLPPNFTNTTQRALVVNLHGGSGNMVSAQGFSQMNPVADENNFVVAWPQGYGVALPGFSWADGRNTSADQAGIDDVGFIDKLIDTLINRYNINSNKIYICGFSNGGFMVQRLACQLTGRFAAMASLGSSMDTVLHQNCNPVKPVPIAFFNGTADPAMPYTGGPMQNPQVIPVVPVDTTVQFWVTHNNCQTALAVVDIPDTFTTDNSTAQLYNYTNCDCNADVAFYKLIDGGHTWPGVYVPSQAGVLGNTNRDINASIALWDFFNAHSLCSDVNSLTELTKNTITLYPNPAQNTLNINLSQAPTDNINVQVLNPLGQVVNTAIFDKSAGQKLTIDIGNLPAGIYFVKINMGNGVKTLRLIKE